MIIELLKRNQDLLGDVFDFSMDTHNAVRLDLSRDNPTIPTDVIYDVKAQKDFVFGQIKQAGGRVGVGGYLENRDLYRRSSIFDEATDSRSIHLGIDLWIEADTSVFAPFEGEVLSVKNNAALEITVRQSS